MQNPSAPFAQSAYTQFLEANQDAIAAVAWSQYRTHGKGLLQITPTPQKTYQLRFVPLASIASAPVRGLVERYDPKTEFAVTFPDGATMRCTPNLPPPECDRTISPRRSEFVKRQTKGFGW